MDKYNIELPPIRDDESGYKYLIKLVSFFMEYGDGLYFLDFKKCSIIEHNGLVVLGGICNYLRMIGKDKKAKSFFGLNFESVFFPDKIAIKHESVKPLVMSKLVSSKFMMHFEKQHSSVIDSKDYIGYREHYRILNDDDIATHLRDHWLTDEKVKMGSDLKNAVVSKIFEVFMNAYGHGLRENESGLSVISCGQYDEKNQKLSLSVLDFGVGVVNSVRRHLNYELSDIECMIWALTVGNSTKTDSVADIPRGLGFGILKDFVNVNKGQLRIISNTCHSKLNAKGDYEVYELDYNFPGTLVTITINCDDRRYDLVSNEPCVESYF
jgi:hypothetical protein